ncbi:uncharacterized protein C2845_PM02G40850 [Panicum miliaceum]|uniref:Uncharacterized protein n=1 Tax=Panicum miliaceum TaxID=4540 RepID=A0A3L6S8B5_PANMI|nr:uncharacterized protein C2845_PM02G40850 [Panicum miliaceum]
MAAHLVVSCCLPGASPSSRAKAAAASSSSPPASNLKATKSRGDHTRIGRRYPIPILASLNLPFVLTNCAVPSSHSSGVKRLCAQEYGTKPSYLGVQKNPPSLALCPATNNCVSTSEEISDSNHYAPPWNYNPKDGRRGKPITKEEAMKELIEVVTKTKPDNFTPRIVEKTDDYVRVEYESPIFGFVDDLEFWFPPGNKAIVQYRSASRSGFVDFNANKKRVKAEYKHVSGSGLLQ